MTIEENIGLRTFFTRTIRENMMDEILVRSSTGSSRHRKNIFPRSISPVELLVKHTIWEDEKVNTKGIKNWMTM